MNEAWYHPHVQYNTVKERWTVSIIIMPRVDAVTMAINGELPDAIEWRNDALHGSYAKLRIVGYGDTVVKLHMLIECAKRQCANLNETETP